ncbi:MAG: 16S rRNA (guanine(527)-N(7))-methyltransferase RsmG [Terriglobales bacterium]
MLPLKSARLATLLEPFLKEPLSPSLLDQISIYIDLLQRWNARVNLTAIRQEEEIVTRHFGESFFLARHLFPTPRSSSSCHPERSENMREAHVFAESKACPERSRRDPYRTNALSSPEVLDIGSGAGFPAVPLKLWAPHIHLTLVESNHKKAAFLREVTRALTLTNINVTPDRLEALAASPGFPRSQVVTFRAVERFDAVLRQAVAFLAPKATLALLIGAAQIPHLTALTTINWQPPIPVPQSRTRVLSIGVLQ